MRLANASAWNYFRVRDHVIRLSETTVFRARRPTPRPDEIGMSAALEPSTHCASQPAASFGRRTEEDYGKSPRALQIPDKNSATLRPTIGKTGEFCIPYSKIGRHSVFVVGDFFQSPLIAVISTFIIVALSHRVQGRPPGGARKSSFASIFFKKIFFSF